jgi:hypothetical protein
VAIVRANMTVATKWNDDAQRWILSTSNIFMANMASADDLLSAMSKVQAERDAIAPLEVRRKPPPVARKLPAPTPVKEKAAPDCGICG